jgi:hypothetical protein
MALGAAGCVTTGSSPKAQGTLASPVLSGKVLRYFPAGRYLVIQFPPGSMPERGQLMPVYRKDFRVGEIKITGPQLEDTIAADLVDGEAEAGDAVRSR